jgi:hypothetical protein
MSPRRKGIGGTSGASVSSWRWTDEAALRVASPAVGF